MEKTYRFLKILILVLAFAVVLAGANVLYQRLGSQVQLREPEDQAQNAAPDFTVYDREGNAVKLSDFRGKPVVVNFWASWCGPCKMEMPDFQTAYETYGEQVTFLMVNLTDGSQETVDSAWEYISGQGYTFPVYYDTQFIGAMAYSVTAIPMTCFIDAQGNLVSRKMSALSADQILEGLEAILETGEA